jgi:DNA-binding NtrC family response regulator
VSKKALDLLTSYSWPGNVRELRNILEYAAIMVSDELIRPEHLRLTSATPSAAAGGAPNADDFTVSLSPGELSLDAINGKALEMALQRCGGNKSQAAALLKVNRKIFYR